MSATDKIAHHVNLVTAEYGNSTMTTNSYIDRGTLAALEALALACGATERAIAICDIGELITVYKVALKRPASGQEVAAKYRPEVFTDPDYWLDERAEP